MTIAEADAALLAQVAEWAEDQDLRTLDSRRLADLGKREGLDFATALLHDRILRVPANAAFQEEAHRSPQFEVRPVDLIGVVPGAFYREHRDTGADGAQVLALARNLSIPAELIPTASFGTLESNAHAVLEWLNAHRGKRIAILSLSKGGADVRESLSIAGPIQFDDVIAWVNFSGVVQGTPLIEWLRQRPLRWWTIQFFLWWRGHDRRALKQLRYNPDSTWPEMPPHLRLVHVYGFPTLRHLSHPWAPRGYARVAPLGPNDGGGILLADCVSLPGIICPIWGADHYLTPERAPLSLLTGIVAAALAPRQAIQSAQSPMTPPAARSIT